MIPKTILNLIERFNENISVLKESDNETQVRIEYLNPFFKELGWDVENCNPDSIYREVSHEYTIRDETGKAKKADYCFQIGKTPLFFVEAKTPSILLKKDPKPAYQLRKYGWNAKVPVGILTDFEEFAIYDCRYEPKITDKADQARVSYLTYQEYETEWNNIAALFSRDSVAKGSLDEYVKSLKVKRGILEVDEAFLKEMESWREMLAMNIALRNPGLTQREINFAVQRTIDRIIFLRICEDRDIEPYGALQKLREKKEIYPHLVTLYDYADKRYNSGLFYFKQEKNRPEEPDGFTKELIIDDDPLNKMIERLYYPAPYAFSIMPADILGQIYERFLGKVIRLSSDRKIQIEEKPEVRKAGGVYYTPTYIVDYIIKQTVGKLTEDKTPKDIETLRILDPACGSGSFLINAYQFLLDRHLIWYKENNPEKYAKGKKAVLMKNISGEWKLTIDMRKRILLNNIFGVDIDSQAVEVTKLSLLLKVLEGEDAQTVQRQLGLFKERALPDLGRNIKCGNSLIGSDFYQGEQRIFDEEEVYRINVFDWEGKEGFPEIMKSGGFDAVIGNPPYVRQETLGDAKIYFQKHFSVYQGTADLYVYFIEKSLSLLNQHGFFGFIVSNKWMRANYGKPLRQWMKQQHISEITDFGDLPVFEQATTYPCILLMKKSSPEKAFKAVQVKNLKFSDLTTYVNQNSFDIEQASLEENGWSLGNRNMQNLLDKLKKSGVPLSEYVNGQIYRGIVTGLNEAFVIDEATRNRLICEDAKSEEIIKPFLAGRDIKRYQAPESDKYLIFTRRGINIKEYPAVENYLHQFKQRLMPKPKDWKEEKWEGRKPGAYKWYEIQDTIDYYQEFEKPKIIYPNICKKPEFTFDENNLYTNQKCFIISLSDKYLLGILNSSVTFFLFRLILPKLRGGFYEPSYIYFKDFPIYKIDFNKANDKTNHERIVSLVDQMLDLHKQISAAKHPQQKTAIQRQIDAVDKQIDRFVYQLYGLTEEEIRVVEL